MSHMSNSFMLSASVSTLHFTEMKQLLTRSLWLFRLIITDGSETARRWQHQRCTFNCQVCLTEATKTISGKNIHAALPTTTQTTIINSQVHTVYKHHAMVTEIYTQHCSNHDYFREQQCYGGSKLSEISSNQKDHFVYSYLPDSRKVYELAVCILCKWVNITSHHIHFPHE